MPRDGRKRGAETSAQWCNYLTVTDSSEQFRKQRFSNFSAAERHLHTP